MSESSTSLFLTKKTVSSIVAANDAAHHHGLKRTLGWPSLMALGVGGIIGAGIFVLTGTAAADIAGPAVMMSFVLSGSPAPSSPCAMRSSPR